METTFRPTELMQNIAIYTIKKSLDIQKQSTLASMETIKEQARVLANQTINKGLSLDISA